MIRGCSWPVSIGQRLVDRAGIAGQHGVFAGMLAALHVAATLAMAASAENLSGILRHAGHTDLMGRHIRRNLDKPHSTDPDR